MKIFVKICSISLGTLLTACIFLAGTDLLVRWINFALGKAPGWLTESFAGIPEIITSSAKAALPWMLGTSALFATIVIAYTSVVKRKIHKRSKKFKDIVDESPETSIHIRQDLEDRIEIARLFLNIYRRQLGAPRDAPGSIRPIDSWSEGQNQTYELKVVMRKKWKSRRISIGKLGLESRSKSKCFYVIYDDHLVVKIPPYPITDFESYIKCLETEKIMAKNIAPRECVVPTVSIILKKLNAFYDRRGLSPERIENRSIGWLRANAEYHDYLKINDSFIFFMDLARHNTLGNVIQEMHDIEAKMYNEIVGYPDIFDNFQNFASRYGQEHFSAYADIKDVFEKYQSEIKQFLIDSSLSYSIPGHKMKEWFLVHLAGRTLQGNISDLHDSLAGKIDALLREIMESNSDAVKAYRQRIREFTDKLSFDQNSRRMEGIATNILELLTWLKSRAVAVRDLKPDNLLVIGDPDRYPFFMNTPQGYSLGLIDLETSVYLGTEDENEIQQPQLAGTPSYATPSHLMGNEILTEYFDNLRLIFNLQDWYATIAMIHVVITGKRLFKQTGKLLPIINKRINEYMEEEEPLEDFLSNINRLFWRSAIGEFREKTTANRGKLKSIHILIPSDAKDMIGQALTYRKDSLLKQIKSEISSQSIFQHPKADEYLHKASSLNLDQLKKRWEEGRRPKRIGQKELGRITHWLEHLRDLKLKFETGSSLIMRLQQKPMTIAAYDLLDVMFDYISDQMYSRHWMRISDESKDLWGGPDDEKTFESTAEIDLGTMETHGLTKGAA